MTGISIYILCGNAAFNRGDRANLCSQIRLLKEYYPNATIVLDSMRHRVDSEWYDAKVIPSGRFFLSLEQVRALAACDVIIWGGGALLADNSCRSLIPYWMAIILYAKVILKKPIMAWAHGVVLETKMGAWLSKILLGFVNTISVRDSGSKESLLKIGVKKPIEITADPAILLNIKDKEQGIEILKSRSIPLNGKKMVGLGFTFWPFYHHKNDLFPYYLSSKIGRSKIHDVKKFDIYFERIKSLTVDLIDHLDANVVYIPRYPCAPWKDLEILNQIAKEVDRGGRVHVYEDDELPPEEFFSIWNCFDMYISTALHDAIVSVAYNVPCVHIFYEEKGRNFFKDADALDLLCSLPEFMNEDGVGRVMSLAKKALKEWPNLGEKILRAKKDLKISAAKNAELLQCMMNKDCEK